MNILVLSYIKRKNINGDLIERYFYPINKIDEIDHCEFLIRIYSDENKFLGNFTEYLEKMKKGEKIEINGPFFSYNYCGYGNFLEKDKWKNYDNIVIFCEEYNISSFFQFLETKTLFGKEKNNIELVLFVNSTEHSILIDELLYFNNLKGLKLTYVNKENNWPFDKDINQNIVKNIIPDFS